MLHHLTSEPMALTNFMPTMSRYKLVIKSVFIQIKMSLLRHVQSLAPAKTESYFLQCYRFAEHLTA